MEGVGEDYWEDRKSMVRGVTTRLTSRGGIYFRLICVALIMYMLHYCNNKGSFLFMWE